MKFVARILPVLERKTGRLLAKLAEAPPRDLHRAPVEGAWSPLQVMQHIALVERASVDYLLYKYGQHEPPPRQTLRTRFNGKVAVASLASPLKFKAPPAVDVARQDVMDAPTLDDVHRDLLSTRADFRRLLSTAPPAWLAGAVYRHPRAGRMSLDDLALMLLTHHNRHEKQIERGLAKNARDHRR